MSNVKDKLKDAGQAVADAAKAVGQKVAEGTGQAVDFVKDKTGLGKDKAGNDLGVGGIKEHMPVYASCGTKVGTVDGVDGDNIKLTASDSKDGLHHWIPTAWVERVDSHVHLTKNSMECETAMKTGVAGSGL